METFASLREHRIVRLNENKDRFIQKNTILTDEQKQEVLDFFHSHANLESKVNNGNWNYTIPYEEFKKVMDSVDTEEKRLKKQTKELRKQTGLEGLVEGEDYSIFTDTSDYIAYRPLTHKAMRVIASNMVEPKLWCESSIMTWTPKEVLPSGEPMKGDLYPGAKWCVAMETDKHWKRYTKQDYNFVVVCNKDPNRRAELKKICLAYKGWELSMKDSVTASDASLVNVQSDYVKKVIDDLDTILHGEESSFILDEIQKCYHPRSKVYKLSKKIVSPQGLLRLGKLDHPVVWEGDFTINGNLESLIGCPNKVTGNFDCSCSHLTSLEGAPEYVGGSFRCSSCLGLTSLKGAPKKVGKDFYCIFCKNLTSLEGAPEDVGRDFDCTHCYKLKSLEGAPKQIGGTFHCSHCSITSLKGAPESVGRGFYCSGCDNLTSLEGAPKSVGWGFDCSDCKSLTSLKGAPKHIEMDFDCKECKSLVSLEGAPEKVGGNFDCSRNRALTSLEGAPKEVGRDFICYDCGKPFYKDVETLSTEATNFVV